MHQADSMSEAGEQRERNTRLVADRRRLDLFAVLDDAEQHRQAEHIQVRLTAEANSGAPG